MLLYSLHSNYFWAAFLFGQSQNQIQGRNNGFSRFSVWHMERYMLRKFANKALNFILVRPIIKYENNRHLIR